jgi:C-terminal processing protease CtpA/Prc
MRPNSIPYSNLITKWQWLPALCLLLFACKKDELPYIPDTADGRTNKWIADSMRRYYYWNGEIPGNLNYGLAPQDFFRSLLSAKDRFSWISNRSDIGPVESTMDQYGFHYVFVNHPYLKDQLLGATSLVAPESPAARAGLQRGICFTRVNGMPFTAQNLETVNALLVSGQRLRLTTAALQEHVWVEQQELEIDPAFINPRGVYSNRVFEKNGIKTGYLFYNAFSESEDKYMLEAMAKLKAAGIRECILDLRYNPGGSVPSAAKMAAMLAPVSQQQKVFLIFKGNQNGGVISQTFAQAIQYSANSYGRDLAALQSLNPGMNRIFILSSGLTASAAELLINCLRPYLQVVLIGEKTLGKDEAGFKIEDARQPRQVNWVLAPTIYKLFNARNEGNYDQGIAPDHAVNELDHFPLLPVGEPADPLIAKALQLIYGSSDIPGTDLRVQRSQVTSVKPVYNSMEKTAQQQLMLIAK